MEAIARVAGGVAHEVNNMMTVITGFSGFLEGTLAAGDPRAEDVAEIRPGRRSRGRHHAAAAGVQPPAGPPADARST